MLKVFISVLLLLYPTMGRAENYLVTRSSPVNLRIGPGRHYRVEWVYTKKEVPLKILVKTDGWSKVEDCEGAVGWIMSSLLYKKNYVSAKKGRFLKDKRMDAPQAFSADACIIMRLDKCTGEWCKITTHGKKAWVPKVDLWGIDS